MPDKLKTFLESLTPQEAKQVWVWADGPSSDVCEDIIAIVAPISHKQ